MSRAFVAALEGPRHLVHNQAFNVGRTAENYRIRDIAQIVVETVPGSRIEFAPDAEPDKRNYKVNMEKIAQTLPDFKPQWDVRRGAQELYAAYQQTGISVEEFEGARYRRVSHIKELLADGRLDGNLRWRELAFA
jgi:nucleoside-diphosphate-sugar epimerase